MTDPIDVADIPGVSPAQASAMAAVGVHLSGDLLRSDRQALVRGVAGITLEEVRKWQSFSRLLEGRGMTPDIVQALLAADFNTPAELAGARLSRVTTALAGVVSDPDAIVDLMLGAPYFQLVVRQVTPRPEQARALVDQLIPLPSAPHSGSRP